MHSAITFDKQFVTSFSSACINAWWKSGIRLFVADEDEWGRSVMFYSVGIEYFKTNTTDTGAYI